MIVKPPLMMVCCKCSRSLARPLALAGWLSAYLSSLLPPLSVCVWLGIQNWAPNCIQYILSMAFVCFCLCVGGYQINIHESSFTWYIISFAFNWVDVVVFCICGGVDIVLL